MNVSYRELCRASSCPSSVLDRCTLPPLSGSGVHRGLESRTGESHQKHFRETFRRDCSIEIVLTLSSLACIVSLSLIETFQLISALYLRSHFTWLCLKRISVDREVLLLPIICPIIKPIIVNSSPSTFPNPFTLHLPNITN